MTFLGLNVFTVVCAFIAIYFIVNHFRGKSKVHVKDLSPQAEKWKSIITQISAALLIIAGFGSIGQIDIVAKLLSGMGYVVENFDSGYEVALRAIDLVLGLGLIFGIGKKKEEEIIEAQSLLK